MKKCAAMFVLLAPLYLGGAVSSGVAATLVEPHAPIFSSRDPVIGGRLEGGIFNVRPRWPRHEAPLHAIDGVGQKFLFISPSNAGIIVTPTRGASVAGSMTLWTANDMEGRDPASYALYGTNEILGDGDVSLSLFTQISTGGLDLPSVRNPRGTGPLTDAGSQTIRFANTSAYTSYMIVFPTIKDAASSWGATQIGEIQLHAIPEPATGVLVLLGLCISVARRR